MRSAGAFDPTGAESVDELVERLRQLRAWAGRSYRQVHADVVRLRKARGVPELPAMNTVYRCFEPGRSWLDLELVVDVAQVLLDDDELAGVWRRACQVVFGLTSAASMVEVSANLPADLPHFTGRREELRLLTELVAAPRDHGVVSVINGMPGVGKTALAVHACHRFLGDGLFGDLQLAVNLRGFDPQRPAVDPAAVLDGFLRALGLSGAQIQHLGLAERSATFRRLLAGREALILLDNAAGARQVRPLLPENPRCLTIITSRRTLAELSEVQRLPLEVFSAGEAIEYLRRAVGDGRVGADPRGARQVTELLGHMPLALAVVAARVRATPDWTISDHGERLADQRDRLRLEDAVEISLSTSYQQLPEPVRRTVQLAGLHPGQDLDAYATAALTGTDLTTARAHLDHLVASNLLRSRPGDRFDFHDLVRSYAAARARDEEAPRARRAAMTRLLDYYARAASSAMDTYAPHERHRRPLAVGEPGPLPDVSTLDQAIGWLDGERINLLAAAEHAAEHGWPAHTMHQSATLWRYLATRGRNHDAMILHSRALDVADGQARGHELTRLGNVYKRLNRYDEALARHRQALAIAREFGDTPHEADILSNIGTINWRLGRYHEALEHHRASLDLGTRLGEPLIELKALNNLGIVFERLGRNQDALEHYGQALTRAKAASARTPQGAIHGNIGVVQARVGNLDEAFEHYRAALRLARETGDQEREARTLNNLGVALERSDRLAEAREHQQRSLAIACAIGDHAGQAYALTGLGVVLARLDQPADALDHHRRALAMARQINDQPVEIQVHLNTGETLSRLGSNEPAIEHFQQALASAGDLGELPAQARAHRGLGTAALAAGHNQLARDHFTRAHALYSQLGMPEASRA